MANVAIGEINVMYCESESECLGCNGTALYHIVIGECDGVNPDPVKLCGNCWFALEQAAKMAKFIHDKDAKKS